MNRILLFLSILTFCTSQEILSQTTIEEKLNNDKQNSIPLEQHLFLHTNRSLFEAMDTLWFKGYVVQGPLHQASDVSQSMIVALIDKDNNVIYEKQFLIYAGTAEGQIIINKSLVPGFYQLVAYASNMLNFDIDNAFRTTIEIRNKKLKEYNYSFALNKRFYQPNDTITLQMFAYDKKKRPLSKDYFWYSVDDGSTNEIETIKIRTDDKGQARFKIPYSPAQNSTSSFKINFVGLHDWQQNSGLVKIPEFSQALDVQILPEGGDLVDGLLQTVAFRSIDNTGSPVNISGKVINQNGKTISSFNSIHQGMGKFVMVPDANDVYSFVIEEPVQYKNKVKFPSVLKKGYVLTYIGNKDSHSFFRVNKNFTIPLKITAVWQMGNIVLSTQSFMLEDEKIVKFKTENLPTGIAKLTLFDPYQQPVAERLVFIETGNKNRLNIDLSKKKYKSRQKVEVNLSALTNDSLPLNANLSVMVTHIKKGISELCDVPDIREYTILKTELSGKVYEPEQYFDNGTDAKLLFYRRDLLMLTHGWRKFTWYYQLTKMQNPEYSFFNYDSYHGSVTKGKELAASTDINVLCLSKGIEKFSFKSDNQGRFSLHPEFEAKLNPIIIFHADRKNRFSRIRLNIEDKEKEMRDSVVTNFSQELDSYTFIQDYFLDEKKTIVQSKAASDSILKIWDTEYIKEVTKTAKRKLTESEEDLAHMFGKKYSLSNDDIGNKAIPLREMFLRLSDRLEYLNGEIIHHSGVGMGMAGNNVSLYGQVDNSQSRNRYDVLSVSINDELRYDSFIDLDHLTSDMVDRVAYIYNPLSGKGSIHVWMDRSKAINPNEKLNKNSFVSQRYDKVRTFYMPKYQSLIQKESSNPDRRVSMYWNNNIKTDSLGNAVFSFYTSDIRGDYLINIQGITKNNGPIFNETVITVE